MVDWQRLIPAMPHEAVRKLDEQGTPVKTVGSYLRLLAEYSDTPAPESLLDHLHFSFLIRGDVLAVQRYVGNLIRFTINSEQSSGIMSGKLSEWRTLIQDCCKPGNDFRVIEVMNAIYLFFEQAGLKHIWNGIQKRSVDENTRLFYLA